MNRRTFLAAAAASAGASPVFAAQAGDETLARLEQLRAEAGVPALGGAIVKPDGLHWQGVSGLRQRDGDAAVSLSDRWHLGSNTKAMTAALYARLVEQGRAAWGATLPQLFPDLDVDEAWGSITIEHLFGHRAGVVDQIAMPVWMITAWADADVRELRTNLARSVLSITPAGQPGDFSYSNAGYILAGAAIERITGEAWEITMQREVFEPLAMAAAGFGAPAGDNAWGHRGANLHPMDPAVRGSDNPAALGPAGTVHATMEDYARFLRVFLTDGGGWLTHESIAHLTRPFTGAGQAYAAGWGVVAGPDWTGGQPALTHDGSNTLWLARTVVAPARGTALICVANAADPAETAIDGLTRALIERFLSD